MEKSSIVDLGMPTLIEIKTIEGLKKIFGMEKRNDKQGLELKTDE